MKFIHATINILHCSTRVFILWPRPAGSIVVNYSFAIRTYSDTVITEEHCKAIPKNRKSTYNYVELHRTRSFSFIQTFVSLGQKWPDRHSAMRRTHLGLTPFKTCASSGVSRRSEFTIMRSLHHRSPNTTKMVFNLRQRKR